MKTNQLSKTAHSSVKFLRHFSDVEKLLKSPWRISVVVSSHLETEFIMSHGSLNKDVLRLVSLAFCGRYLS